MVKLLLLNVCNISKKCPVGKVQTRNEEISIIVKRQNLINMLLFLKNHMLCQFKILTYISGLDFPNRKRRFSLIYDLLSIRYNFRLKIKLLIDELSFIPTTQKLFPAAGWYESEIWDMFGIFFEGHLNLKRILTDYGFEGHPLKKDFPLSGYFDVFYNEYDKRVSGDIIELSQEFRPFYQPSPWLM